MPATAARTTRRAPTHRAPRARRTRPGATLALASAAALVAGLATPAAADAGDLRDLVVPADGVAASRVAPEDRPARPFATIEDEDAWCAWLSDYYLAFTSPWAARVINCRHSDLFVAPLHHDGTLGRCVLVPARHSRHLGGSITRRVVDIRLC